MCYIALQYLTSTFFIHSPSLRAFAQEKCVVCIHKHYTPEEWVAFYNECPEVFPYLAVSAGSSDVRLV
jgi:hypothetical protein